MVVKDINVSKLLDDYLDHLKTSGMEMGLFAARSTVLHKIDKGCGLFSKPEDVAEWIRRRGVTNETRKQYTEHLQAFYEWVAAKPQTVKFVRDGSRRTFLS